MQHQEAISTVGYNPTESVFNLFDFFFREVSNHVHRGTLQGEKLIEMGAYVREDFIREWAKRDLLERGYDREEVY